MDAAPAGDRSIAPKPSGDSISPLEAHAAFLFTLIAQQPDLALDEIVAAMHKRAERGKRYKSFDLRMQTEASDLIEEGGRVVGLRAKTPNGMLAIRADVVVGADGRHSTIRDKKRRLRCADGRTVVSSALQRSRH